MKGFSINNLHSYHDLKLILKEKINLPFFNKVYKIIEIPLRNERLRSKNYSYEVKDVSAVVIALKRDYDINTLHTILEGFTSEATSLLVDTYSNTYKILNVSVDTVENSNEFEVSFIFTINPIERKNSDVVL